MIPAGATHRDEFYGQEMFYKRVTVPYLNTLIDHPTEQWQTVTKWFIFESGKWIDVGHGFSPRRLKLIQLDS